MSTEQSAAVARALEHGRPLPVNPAWLALHSEAVLEPELEIVDAHHHLWLRAGWPYLLTEMLADIDTGHRIVGTIFVQCRSMYRPDGPVALRPVGETAFAAESAQKSAGRVCTGIVCHADLRLGSDVQAVLEAHLQAADGRLRGVRHSSAWDADPVVANPELGTRAHLLEDSAFLAGFARLAAMGLSYDAWVYHPQLAEVAELARRFPETRIVLNHVGGPVGIGRYAARRTEVFDEWRGAIRSLAACDNVAVKLGGLGMRLSGGGFHARPLPPSSAELALAWKPWIETTIEAFGAARCMFESNFPVDKASCSYATLWNAFKRLAGGCSADERAALFSGTARSTYRLPVLS